MPYVHIKNKNGKPGEKYGSLNNSITVRELLDCLVNAIKLDPSILDKAVLLSDDEEGNCFHGAYYAVTTNPTQVKECLEASNGSDPTPDEYEHAIIIG